MRPAFEEIIRAKTGCAVILAGSDSDQGHIEKLIASLDSFEIPYEVRICSAHKQAQGLLQIIEALNDLDGAVALIAVAGGTDALSGTLSFHTLQPVISCPPDPSNESCLTNPPGSSNATILRANNVGRFVAQMFAPYNPKYREKLKTSIQNKIRTLEGKDSEFYEKYWRI